MKTVIEMAREAGFDEMWENKPRFLAKIQYFAELARADEREACAKVCEERIDFWQRDDGRRYEDEYCAAAIRARSTT